jgi:hypothetical protein
MSQILAVSTPQASILEHQETPSWCSTVQAHCIAFYEAVERIVLAVTSFFVETAAFLFDKAYRWENNLHLTILKLLTCSIIPSRVKYTKAHLESVHQLIRDEFPSAVDSEFRAFVVDMKNVAEDVDINGVQIINMRPSPDDEPPRWILFFLPNLAIWEDLYYPLKDLHKLTNANIICYNYRGCGMSTGAPICEEDLISDGVLILEKLLKKVKAEHVLVHGFSIGGGIATQVVARLAQKGIYVTFCNERSFNSLAQVIIEIFPRIIGPLLASFANYVGWCLNSELALQELKENNIIVLSNESDGTVLPNAQFIGAINRAKAAGTIKPEKVHEITMDPDPIDPHSRYWVEAEKEQYNAFVSRLINIY